MPTDRKRLYRSRTSGCIQSQSPQFSNTNAEKKKVIISIALAKTTIRRRIIIVRTIRKTTRTIINTNFLVLKREEENEQT